MQSELKKFALWQKETIKLKDKQLVLLNILNITLFLLQFFIISEFMINFASEKKLDFFIVKV